MAQKLYTLYRDDETSREIAEEFDSAMNRHYPNAYIRRINGGNIPIRDIRDVTVILIKKDVPLVEMIGTPRGIRLLKTKLETITGFQLREE